jgi:hypothetical protein
MVSVSSVVEAYDSARAAGLTRADSFLRAVEAFRAGRPELSVAEAGTEVARILLHAAASARAAQNRCSLHEAMPRPAISW